MTTLRVTAAVGMVFCIVSACSSSDSNPNATPSAALPAAQGTGGGGPDIITQSGVAGGSAGAPPVTNEPSSFKVDPNAPVCLDDLPFKVPGCLCSPGTPDQACWTGPANQRHVGQCKDGVQKCVGEKEFAQWGPCEGEVLLCNWPPEHLPDGGKPPPSDAGPPPDAGNPPCSCVPGVTIACDEDCVTLVICSLTGYKTCQPDGTWGPCHETDNVNVLENVLGCRNWLHGCLLGTGDGVYTGDCGKAFTCGYVPGTQ